MVQENVMTWWQKKNEIGRKLIFQCFCILQRHFVSFSYDIIVEMLFGCTNGAGKCDGVVTE